ncbi:MAG TPA: hypothetical protein VEZ11_00530 [Thermoanaerobaculia bacterium]|nr:hypothetical protein [Thermoanaerobaculia bacterium]
MPMRGSASEGTVAREADQPCRHPGMPGFIPVRARGQECEDIFEDSAGFAGIAGDAHGHGIEPLAVTIVQSLGGCPVASMDAIEKLGVAVHGDARLSRFLRRFASGRQ